MDLQTQIRDALTRVGRLSVDVGRLGADADLFDAGLTSQAAVELVFDLEASLDVEVPDEALRRESLATIAKLEATLLAAQTAL